MEGQPCFRLNDRCAHFMAIRPAVAQDDNQKRIGLEIPFCLTALDVSSQSGIKEGEMPSARLQGAFSVSQSCL